MDHCTLFLEEIPESYKALNRDKNNECFCQGYNILAWLFGFSLFRDMTIKKKGAKFLIDYINRFYTKSNSIYQYILRTRRFLIEHVKWDLLFFAQFLLLKTGFLHFINRFQYSVLNMNAVITCKGDNIVSELFEVKHIDNPQELFGISEVEKQPNIRSELLPDYIIKRKHYFIRVPR